MIITISSFAGLIAGILFNFLIAGFSLTLLLYPKKDSINMIDRLVLSFALSAGVSTLVMFFSFLIFGHIHYLISQLFLLSLVMLIYFNWRRTQRISVKSLFKFDIEKDNHVFLRNLVLAIALFSCLIVFLRALYWPFYACDAIGHWANRGSEIYTTGIIHSAMPYHGLTAIHNTYPLLLSISYALVAHSQMSWSECVPKVVNALMYMFLIISVYRFGKFLDGKIVGYFSVIILCFTPLLTMFASVGYADIPLAFFYTLSAYYGLRFLKDDSKMHLLTSALLASLGAWTKIEAVPMVVILFMTIMVIYVLKNKKLDLRIPLFFGVSAAIIDLPWYFHVRSLISGTTTYMSTTFDFNRLIEVILALLTMPIKLTSHYPSFDPYGISAVIYLFAFGMVSIFFIYAIVKRINIFLLLLIFLNVISLIYLYYGRSDLDVGVAVSAPRFFIRLWPLIIVTMISTISYFFNTHRGVLNHIKFQSQRKYLNINVYLVFLVLALLLPSSYIISSGGEIKYDCYTITHTDANLSDKYYQRFGYTYSTLEKCDEIASNNSTILILDEYWYAQYLFPDHKYVLPILDSTVSSQIYSQNITEFLQGLKSTNTDYIVIHEPKYWVNNAERYRIYQYVKNNSDKFEKVWFINTSQAVDYSIFKVLM